ncbi:MAG: HDOD domain-containing protein [Desulfomonilia bacterium]|jgi:putative nucleotidyltransferase with HDIG domain|nr:HDOD domain-containing protein [Deltaproteobacteria bacterium]MDX9761664.1 HDOD domain-containing protein [Desulfomonilia bacterium]HPW68054.1 HDOD domain-containing protein [Deltaproteobacteria bacterium]
MDRLILQTVKHLEDLPTLPSVAVEVMGLSRSPDVSIKAISACIHKDPPLAAKVLKLANSAFYRRGAHEIETLHRAILMMGLNEVVNITTSVSVLSSLGPRKSQEQGLRKKFWRHCIATGLIARRIDTRLHMSLQGREFVGGLLHDIGKIILDEYFHDQFMQAHALSLERQCPMFEAEQEILGATHMEIGHFLAQKWGLPPYIADICLHHHHPQDARFKDITSVVSIADLLAKAKELSCGGDTMSFILKDQQGWHILKKMGHPMDSIDLERITFEIEDIGEEVKEFISAISDQEAQEHAHV